MAIPRARPRARTRVRLSVVAAFLFLSLSWTHVHGEDVTLEGSGATFPQAVVEAWASQYAESDETLSIQYRGGGSTAGLEELHSSTVDYAIVDTLPTDEQLEGLQLIPALGGAVVVSFNLPGTTNLVIDRDTVAKIFMGEVTHWNDAEMTKNNPGLVDVAHRITLCLRRDPSGSTQAFTRALSLFYEPFASLVGVSDQPTWHLIIDSPREPVLVDGTNEMATCVSSVPYSFGYLPHGEIPDDVGTVALPPVGGGAPVVASPASIERALAAPQFDDKLRADLVNATLSEGAYPICLISYFAVRTSTPRSCVAQDHVARWYRWTTEENEAENIVLAQGYGLMPTLGRALGREAAEGLSCNGAQLAVFGGCPITDNLLCGGHGTCVEDACACDSNWQAPLCVDRESSSDLQTGMIAAIVIVSVMGAALAAYSYARLRDNSSRLAAHMELGKRSRRQADQSALLSDAAGDAVVAFRVSDGVITRANRACAEIFQLEEGNVAGRMCIHDLLGLPAKKLADAGEDEAEEAATSPFRDPSTQALLCELFGADVASPVLVGVRSDGEDFPALVTLTSYPGDEDDDEDEGEYLMLVRDMTLLERSRRELERAARSKGAFLANMSHEVRTPLNGIVGMTHLLLNDDQLGGHLREYVETLSLSADMLLSCINDVLDYSKLEAGKMTLEKIEVNLVELLEECANITAFKAYEKGIEISSYVHIRRTQRELVVADPVRIKQIILNLLSNAIRFTPSGEVWVSCTITDLQSDTNFVDIRVTDTGEGIDEADHKALFERFRQAKQSTTRMYGGTGLGLPICKELCELMEGTLTLQSSLGEGTVVTASLPLAKSTNSDRKHRFWHNVTEAVHMVLWIPHERTRTIFTSYASAHVKPGMLNTVVVHNHDMAEAALSHAVAAAGADDSIYFVTTVLAEQAIDLLNTLRDDMRKRVRGVWLYPITSKVSRDASQCFYSLIPLPLSLRSLTNLFAGRSTAVGGAARALPGVRGVPQQHQQQQQPLPRAQAGVLPPGMATAQSIGAVPHAYSSGGALVAGEAVGDITVLCVDDREANRVVLSTLLKRYDLNCVLANDGAHAVSLFDPRQHHVVLMDCEMPIMDGFEAANHIRQKEQSFGDQHVPIIAVTAYSSQRNRALASGMDDYIAKPFAPVDLVQKIRQAALATRMEKEKKERRERRRRARMLNGDEMVTDSSDSSDGSDSSDSSEGSEGGGTEDDMGASYTDSDSDSDSSIGSDSSDDRSAAPITMITTNKASTRMALPKRAAAAAAAVTPLGGPPAPRRIKMPTVRDSEGDILVVDDDIVQRMIFCKVLVSAGYRVVVAIDGRQAVQKAATHTFQLVILDLNMPHMDGYEASRAIRCEDSSQNKLTPIIACTSAEEDGVVLRQRCVEAGMDELLLKPVTRADLMRVAQTFCSPNIANGMATIMEEQT